MREENRIKALFHLHLIPELFSLNEFPTVINDLYGLTYK